MTAGILVTGGTGFIGTAVRRALAEAAGGHQPPAAPPRLLVHRRPAPAGPAAELVPGDLTDPASLRGCCDGIRVLVHLASEVGPSPHRCAAVNLHGTRALLAEAERAGIRHVVYLSTAAVHGTGPHRLAGEDRPPRPVSPASQTRYAAEQLVRAAGGIVLRPLFVYGDGDRWFVPGVLRWLTRRPPLWIGAGARASVVAVDDLARVVAAAATRPAALAGPLPFHVCEPAPVLIGQVQRELVRLFGLQPPRLAVPGPAAAVVPPVGRRLRRLRRQLELLSRDHTYAADRIWSATGLTPGRPMLDRLAAHRRWYRRFVPVR